MKKIVALVLTLCLVLTSTAAMATSSFDSLQQMLRGGNTAETTAPDVAVPEETVAPAPEAEENSLVTVDASNNLSVLDVNVIMSTEDYSSFIDCYVYAIISNDGEKNIALDGSITVMDAEGNVLEEQNYLFPTPSVLEPGATAVLVESMLVSKTDTVTLPEHIAAIELSVMKDKYGDDTRIPVYTACEVTYGPGVDRYGNEVPGIMSFTITNNTGAELKNPTAVAALYDANDKLICVVADQMYSSGMVRIPEDGVIMFDSEVYYYIHTWMDNNGVTPASIQCMAFGE